MNPLAITAPPQLGGFTSFIHTVPLLILYLLALGLFLLLAKSERLGGLSFRHVIIALVYGLIGSAFVPVSFGKDVNALSTPSHRTATYVILSGLTLLEFIMIIRDRRKGGGE